MQIWKRRIKEEEDKGRGERGGDEFRRVIGQTVWKS